MVRNLLREFISYDKAHSTVELVEDMDTIGNKVKSLYMKGIFIQGGIRNANQRVYPITEINSAVSSIKRQINENLTIFGELDHPEDLKINLDRVSHIITDMWMEGADGYGKLKILPTPLGQIAKTILENGGKLGVSSRGSGNVNESTGNVSDFEIITVDIVATPSAPQAYPKPIYEGLLNLKHGYKALEIASEANSDPKVQKFLQEQVVKLIKDLKI